MPPSKPLPPFIESWPGLGFLALWLFTGDLRAAGWTGATLALTVFAALAWRRRAPDGIALGINLFTLLCAPLIETLHLAGLAGPRDWMLGHIPPLLLLSVALTGAGLTLLTPRGLVGRPGPGSRRGSLALVLLALLGALVLAYPPAPALPLNAGVLLFVLFCARGWLAARHRETAA
ncbi:hypothetical protein [Limimaricola hongkongensis]|uniref:Uncharacterized protein n=1 Tax=Limimaricola hongkongensis DSM 17492 TaxID=1122180 RepID=A0A017HDQ3_9RHOB|nr:hypothetical protein [Limimaricola hongkongensis]EYD72435.1 hypothetical protein Lokhon_01234 [Limimaricola hongkongensis DSM 17492]